ncbi:SIS domain-containing protein [Fervidibacillus halotolerans]|uniref:SIS domain-containing protein n=1 Tax=Fervidibacillus halotolerans TaxID=2980027 RepID=A0A9E8M0X6_9BACI|nr:SIS domain-containing protein [Fervidibacillus halotolerans]WAA13146.1 SIS domain-containing protein [Fervidibacillus halotolerans]
MFEYLNRIRKILDTVEKYEKDAIRQSVEMITEAILKKHSIFAFGASHAGILTQELFYRAGGLININPIFARDLMLDTEPITHTSRLERLLGYGTILAKKTPFTEGDVLILHSVSGRNPVTIELAMEARKKGVSTISITNLAYSRSVSSRHESGKNLYEISDVVIDNHGDIGDATCEIEGVPQKIGPTSTVIGAAIVNTIVVEVVRNLVHQGVNPPPIFYSANLDGGDEQNKKLFEQYKESIHYRYDL